MQGEGALRVVNGSDRQSMVSGVTSPTTPNARNSVLLSELESPTTMSARAGARSQQPTIEEQPFELGEREEK